MHHFMALTLTLTMTLMAVSACQSTVEPERAVGAIEADITSRGPAHSLAARGGSAPASDVVAAWRWCRSGFVFRRGRCVNIDECATGQARCEGACVDTQGSYRCECGEGGALQPDGKHCSSWRSPVKLERDDIGNADAPQIAADPRGNALAVWEQSDGARNSVWSSRRDAATGVWSRAQLLEHEDRGDAAAPQVALASDGSGLAVWEQSDGVRYNIWAAHFDGTTRTWSDAVLVEREDAGDARGPQVAAAESGNGVVVWQQSNGSRTDIWGAQYTVATSAWSAPARIENDDQGDAQSPRVACDEHGDAIAVWEQSDGTHQAVWGTRLVAASGHWEGATRLDDDPSASLSAPDLAVGPDGDAVALWLRTTQAPAYETGIRATHFSAATGGWGAAVTLAAGDAIVARPQVAIVARDRAVAVWEQSNDIWAASFNNGSWGAAHALATPDNGSATRPQVAISPDGTAVAVWDQLVADADVHRRYLLWAARKPADAAVFSTPTLIEPDESGSAGSAAVIIDDAGAAIAVWSGARMNIRTSRLDPSSLGWSAPLQLEIDDTGNAEQPQIAVRPQGDAVVVFRQDDGTRRNIWSNTYDVAARQWRGPTVVTKERTGSSSTPAIALNPAGDALAIWQRGNLVGERTEIWASRSQLAMPGWAQPVQLTTGVLSNGAHDPRVALTEDGAGLAVWRDYNGQYKANIWASWTRPPAAAWSDGFLLEQDAQHSATTPLVAIVPSGDAVAVWVQTDGTHQNLWANRYQSASDSWSGPQKLEDNDSADALNPDLALGSHGDAIVVWQQAQGGVDQVWANQFTSADQRWSGAKALQSTASGAASAPRVALNAKGEAVAVWQLAIAGGQHVWSARSAAGGGGWEAALQIDRDAAPAGSARVVLGADGTAHALWLQRRGLFQHVASSRLASSASSWSSPVTLEQDDIADSSAPELAIDAQGRATAVWSGSRLNVWAARYE